MSAESAAKVTWYIRRGGQQAGPFSSASVRRLLLQDQIKLDDEVSPDRLSWTAVKNVAEVVPPQLRGVGLPRMTGGNEQAVPWKTLGIVVLLLAGIGGFGVWWGGSQTGRSADCTAAAQPGVDWSNCRLRGLRAGGADLKAAWLRNADLFEAGFTGADLTGAKLDYANLGRADLAYTMLANASLRGADLRNADLTNADLSGADLSFADLRGAVLAGAVLRNTQFGKALWLHGETCRPDSLDSCTPEFQENDSLR